MARTDFHQLLISFHSMHVTSGSGDFMFCAAVLEMLFLFVQTVYKVENHSRHDGVWSYA